jgi:hypothetical protein
LAAGESVLLLRSTGSAGAVQIASLSPTGSSSWTFTDTIQNTAASYTYRAQAIDAALNTSALSPGWTVTKLAQSIANAVTITAVNVNGTSVAPVAMVVNNDATPGLTGTLQAGLQAGERVRVYRSGTSSVADVATSVSGATWSYQSPALASGTYTFEVRVEQTLNAALFGASGSVVDVIDVTPPATPTSLAALTSLAPYNNTANPNGDSPTAVLNPAVFSISNGGATSDRSPTLRVQLAQALESGGRFELTGGSALIARTSAQLGSATQIDLTDPVAINTPALGAPTASGLPVLRTYTLTVYDAQGNASGTRSIQFSTNYFSCSQARAQAANSNTTHNDTDVTPSLRWSAAGTAQCLGCHASPTAPGFVAAPPSGTRYWCRKS